MLDIAKVAFRTMDICGLIVLLVLVPLALVHAKDVNEVGQVNMYKKVSLPCPPLGQDDVQTRHGLSTLSCYGEGVE